MGVFPDDFIKLTFHCRTTIYDVLKDRSERHHEDGRLCFFESSEEIDENTLMKLQG